MTGCTAVLLHALGASSREFDTLAERLGSDITPLALDLPGFGDASAAAGTSVEAMADAVVAAVATQVSGRWLLVGHSMGGKIATVVAHRALAGEPGLFGFAGVVLLAGSPPSPEPMDDERRAQMLDWAADGPLDAAAARTFVDANVGAPLPPELDAVIMADLQCTSREAWRAWLDRGSREDWAATVGTLDVPALIVAGGADGDLGQAAQRHLNGAVYPRARFTVLDGAGHLLPLERPAEVADAIGTFWADDAGRGPSAPPEWLRAFASARTSQRTRAILARRALADDPLYRPSVLDATQLATLRLLADLVVPQDGAAIDLAARVEARLAAGDGDGWRPDDLPPDVDAYRAGLAALERLGDVAEPERLAWLAEIVAGSFVPTAGGLSASQLTHWFADARNDLVLQWLAHPATMARIGFDGYLNGGDGVRLAGWQLFAAGEREAWEPPAPTGPVEPSGSAEPAASAVDR